MNKIILIISLIVFNSGAYISAQDEDRLPRSGDGVIKPINIPEELPQKCGAFFEQLVAGDINNAYKIILEKSPLLKKKEDIERLLTQTKRAMKLYGEISSAELVSAEIAAASYMRLRYLSIHEETPMRWIFTFYKSPKNGWLLSNVRFDDLTEFFFSDE